MWHVIGPQRSGPSWGSWPVAPRSAAPSIYVLAFGPLVTQNARPRLATIYLRRAQEGRGGAQAGVAQEMGGGAETFAPTKQAGRTKAGRRARAGVRNNWGRAIGGGALGGGDEGGRKREAMGDSPGGRGDLRETHAQGGGLSEKGEWQNLKKQKKNYILEKKKRKKFGPPIARGLTNRFCMRPSVCRCVERDRERERGIWRQPRDGDRDREPSPVQLRHAATGHGSTFTEFRTASGSTTKKNGEIFSALGSACACIGRSIRIRVPRGFEVKM